MKISVEEGRAYMKRALQLSLMGGPNVSPNPFVGAVIVASGRIIGEGYHRVFGGPHAEVNAVASIQKEDLGLLSEATMFVTLEPCSHFGKTPPCADLIIEKGIPRVFVAAEDPFLKDYESGIEKMRRAGVEVEVGLLGDEARRINRRFFTAHTLRRPFILLKWAQSSDGFIGKGDRQVKFSNPFTQVLAHRERALYDAIMVGVDTVLIDKPRLDCRLWPVRLPEKRPIKVTFDSVRLQNKEGFLLKSSDQSLPDFLHSLYADYGITSLMVEGGSATIDSFLRANLFDEVRIEFSPVSLGGGIPAPDILRMHLSLLSSESFGGNLICKFVKNY